MPSEDLEIIKEVLEGNKEVFRKIIEKYSNPIYSLSVRMLGDLEEAKDVVQETFIKAYKKLSSFKFEYDLKNWLYTIAINIARDKLRKRKFEFMSLNNPISTDENELQLEISNSTNIEEALIQKEEREKILHAINSLPEKYRTVLTLRYKQNLPYEEIAKILKKSLGTIKTLIFRAKNLLQEKLNKL